MVTIDWVVDQAKQISTLEDDKQQLMAATELVAAAVKQTDWILEEHHHVCESQGWTLHPLFVKPDHTFGIFVTGWLPGRGAPAHTHAGWTVIGGLVGVETNTLWTRTDDESVEGEATLEVHSVKALGPGEVLVMPGEGDIHSVINETGAVTLSLHAYQFHPNYCDRFCYDPDAGTVHPFITTPIDEK